MYKVKRFSVEEDKKKKMSKSDKALLGVTGAGLGAAGIGYGGQALAEGMSLRNTNKALELNGSGKMKFNDFRNYLKGHTVKSIKDSINARNNITKEQINEAKSVIGDKFDDLMKYGKNADKSALASKRLAKLGKAGLITAGTAGTLYLGKKTIDKIKNRE